MCMKSRMEKYYHEDLSQFERTKKNQNLYKEVYGYDDEEFIPIPDNSDVIDANSLKKMVKSRGEYQKLKEYELVKLKPVEEEPAQQTEKRVYDINKLLDKAKEENSKIKSMTYDDIKKDHNFLTELQPAMEEEETDSSDEVKITEVKYHTKKISNDPVVNQIISTNSLPLEILTDLKPTEDTIVSEPILEQTRKLELDNQGKTFYSGSYTFSKKDFLEDDDLEEKKGSHYFLKIILLVIILSILITVIFYFVKFNNIS